MKTLLSLTVTLAPLVFGLVAWGLAATRLFARKKRGWFLSASWCCCACALWFPLQAIHRWASMGDVSAILDCLGTYFLCATVLLAGNLLLTGLCMLRKPTGQAT